MTTVLHGPERYSVNVRYMRDYRSSIDALNHILVMAGGQRQTPISELADILSEADLP